MSLRNTMDYKRRMERTVAGYGSFYSSTFSEYLSDNLGRQGSLAEFIQERIKNISRRYVEIKITLTILAVVLSVYPWLAKITPSLATSDWKLTVAFIVGQILLLVRAYWFHRDKKAKARLQDVELKLKQLELEERDNEVHKK